MDVRYHYGNVLVAVVVVCSIVVVVGLVISRSLSIVDVVSEVVLVM